MRKGVAFWNEQLFEKAFALFASCFPFLSSIPRPFLH